MATWTTQLGITWQYDDGHPNYLEWLDANPDADIDWKNNDLPQITAWLEQNPDKSPLEYRGVGVALFNRWKNSANAFPLNP